MDAGKIAGELMAEKVAILDGNVKVVGMDQSKAVEVAQALNAILSDDGEGYVAFEDFSLVFVRRRGTLIFALVDRDRTMWCVRKLVEAVG